MAIQSNFQLGERRRALRRFWRSDATKRALATQRGFAKALGTSTTAVNEFENDIRQDFPNGSGKTEYIRVLEDLERQAARERDAA